MRKEVVLYIEGGGDFETTRRPFRRGFQEFFRDIVDAARMRRISFRIVVCGGRDETFAVFSQALIDSPETFNMLLVDAERPVTSSRMDHFKTHDHQTWKGLDERQCHLMVPVMEAWFLADPEQLQKYYGQNFKKTVLPTPNQLESIEKRKIDIALKNATRKTSKGHYHKIHHGSELLKLVRADLVGAVCPHCAQLFQVLKETIAAP